MPAASASLFPDSGAVEETPVRRVAFDRVVSALRQTRIREAGLDEADIRDRLQAVLIEAGFPAKTEFPFASGCRADIWIDGIVVEVKKKRPDRARVLSQLHRYATQGNVQGIILALERSVIVPEAINGKPIRMLSLNALWGIAL